MRNGRAVVYIEITVRGRHIWRWCCAARGNPPVRRALSAGPRGVRRFKGGHVSSRGHRAGRPRETGNDPAGSKRASEIAESAGGASFVPNRKESPRKRALVGDVGGGGATRLVLPHDDATANQSGKRATRKRRGRDSRPRFDRCSTVPRCCRSRLAARRDRTTPPRRIARARARAHTRRESRLVSAAVRSGRAP